jgi:hypothetical protein
MSRELLQQLYAGLAPWLALSLLLIGRNPYLSRVRIIAALLLALILLGIPVPLTGWNGFAWVRVLEPNPCFTLTALLGIAVTSHNEARAIRADFQDLILNPRYNP